MTALRADNVRGFHLPNSFTCDQRQRLKLIVLCDGDRVALWIIFALEADPCRFNSSS